MKANKCLAMKRLSMKRLSWVVVVLWFCSTPHGRCGRKNLRMITDPSGAFVAGATVTLNNLATGPNKPQPPTTRAIFDPGRSGWEVRTGGERSGLPAT